jgi:hypothetical protein
MVNNPWWRLLEILWTVCSEGPHVLGPREVNVDDGKRGDFLNLSTAGNLAGLVPKP